MAEEKKVEAVAEAAEKPAKKGRKTKVEKKEEVKAPAFPKPNAHDYEVIVAPLITEKTMALMQNANKVTVKVASKSNKVEIKEAFERIFQVKVTGVRVANQVAKTTTRGGRYNGTISGFKKAVVTIAEGEAIDLFKE